MTCFASDTVKQNIILGLKCHSYIFSPTLFYSCNSVYVFTLHPKIEKKGRERYRGKVGEGERQRMQEGEKKRVLKPKGLTWSAV